MAERASRFLTIKAPGTSIESVRALVGDGGVRPIGGFGGWEERPRPRRTAMLEWQGYSPITLEIPLIIRTLSDNADDGKRIEADCINLGMMAGRGEPAPEPRKRKGKIAYIAVRKGDTLAKIAHRHRVDLADLLQLNSSRIKDPAKLKVGLRLQLPQDKDKVPFGQPPILELLDGGNSKHASPLVPYNDLAADGNSIERRQWVIAEDPEWQPARRNAYGDRVFQRVTITVKQYVQPTLVATKATPWRRTKKHRR